jgi:hypothetical protein
VHPAQCLRERVAHQFGAGHAETLGSLKVICHASIVPMSALFCLLIVMPDTEEIYAKVIVPVSIVQKLF